MIESLFKEISALPDEENDSRRRREDFRQENQSAANLLAALPVVQKIARRKRIAGWGKDASDFVQEIAFRLLRWRNKNAERSSEMAENDWRSYAARTAFNEINRHFSSRDAKSYLPLEAAGEVKGRDSVEGETDTEVASLARKVWQEICTFSLRQRRALLLHNEDLIVYFLECGVTDENLAEVLEIEEGEWAELKKLLPLSDLKIAGLTRGPNDKMRDRDAALLVKSVKKARHEARRKLQDLKK